jgi:hypothetical protein
MTNTITTGDAMEDQLQQIRGRIERLEQMRETEKAALLDIYARLERLISTFIFCRNGTYVFSSPRIAHYSIGKSLNLARLQHESNRVRIVKLEEAQEAPAAGSAADR